MYFYDIFWMVWQYRQKRFVYKFLFKFVFKFLLFKQVKLDWEYSIIVYKRLTRNWTLITVKNWYLVTFKSPITRLVFGRVFANFLVKFSCLRSFEKSMFVLVRRYVYYKIHPIFSVPQEKLHISVCTWSNRIYEYVIMIWTAVWDDVQWYEVPGMQWSFSLWYDSYRMK